MAHVHSQMQFLPRHPKIAKCIIECQKIVRRVAQPASVVSICMHRCRSKIKQVAGDRGATLARERRVRSDSLIYHLSTSSVPPFSHFTKLCNCIKRNQGASRKMRKSVNTPSFFRRIIVTRTAPGRRAFSIALNGITASSNRTW